MLSRKAGISLLILVTIAVAATAFLLPRIPQPESYHLFADHRMLFGIPNFADVASNLPFAIVGVWGLIYLTRLRHNDLSRRFLDSRERLPYIVFFVGVLLTAFGSSWYHLHPDNTRLVWDRLPMTIAFMSLVAALIAERISLRAGLWLLPLLLLIGIASVLQWYSTQLRGASDLRFYAAVQLYAVLFLLIVLCLPARYTGGVGLIVVAALYALAKLFETFDRQIFNLAHLVSGHTLKHLAAALASFWIFRMLIIRRPVTTPVLAAATQ